MCPGVVLRFPLPLGVDCLSTCMGVAVPCTSASWLAVGGGEGTCGEEVSATRGDTIASHPCIAAKILAARAMSLLFSTASLKETPSTTAEGEPWGEAGSEASTLMENIEVSWAPETTEW